MKVALFLMALAPAEAFATPVPVPVFDTSHAGIIEVYAGCGAYGHRGPAGYCRAGGQAGGYVPGYSCPRGYHIGPYGRHCWPN